MRRALVAAAVLAAALPTTARADHRYVVPVSEGGAPAEFVAAAADGSAVLFATEDALLPEDLDGAADMYVRRGAELTLVTAPAPGFESDSGEGATFRAASADLATIVYETRQVMAAGDEDDVRDLYAYVDGEPRLLSGTEQPSLLTLFGQVAVRGTSVYFSVNERLTFDDFDSREDVYRWSGGDVTLQSTGFSNEDVFLGGVEAGRVFLLTRASHQSVADNDFALDVYERAGGTITLLTPGTGDDVVFLQASGDGQHMYFASGEPLLAEDADAATDVYERTGGTTLLVSGGTADLDADFMRAAADGSRAVFATLESLEPGDGDETEDLYMRDGGALVRLTTADTAGTPFTTFGGMTPDGEHIFWQTREALGGDTDIGFLDAFHWTEQGITLVSVNGLGTPDRSAGFAGFSADAARLFFQTDGDFAAGDGDGFEDLYERAGGITRLVTPTPAEECFAIPSPSVCEPVWKAVSADGARVVFSSREGLVPGDGDGQADVYESRIGAAPVLDATDAAASHTEGTPTAVDPGLTISDAYGELFGATVRITAGGEASDALGFTDAPGIAGAVEDGVLRLSGRAPVAAYEAALRTVTFAAETDAPSTAARTVEIAVDNGGHTGSATRTITVTPVDDPPSLAAGAPGAYVENAPPAPVAPSLTLTDPDSAQLDGATVAITGGFVAGQDVLSAPSGGFEAGVLTLSGTATVAEYQDLLRAVAYRNASDDPSTAPRTITVTVPGAAPVELTVTVTAVEDATVVEATPGTVAFAEDGPAVAIDSELDLTDPDSATLTGATVRIAGGFTGGEDVLGYAEQGGIAGVVNVAGDTLTLSGTASLAAYQAALRSVTYRNLADDPSAAPRSIEFAVAGGAAPGTRGVTISTGDDPPVLEGTGSATYVEGGPPVAVIPGLGLADVDSAVLTGAEVRVTDDLQAGADVLAASPPGGISAAYDAASGTLTLSGAAPVAGYRDALRSVTFASVSDAPSGATRTLTLRAEASAAVTATVAVVATEDPPAVTLTGAPLAAVAGEAAVLDGGAGVSDPDSPALAGATLRAPGAELLPAGLDDGITEAAEGGTLTMTGAASPAAYAAALRGVRVRAAAPGTLAVAVTVSDGSLSSAEAGRTVEVAAAPPGIAPPAAAAPAAFAFSAPPSLSRRTTRVPARCSVTGASLVDCRVEAFLLRGGDRLLVGVGYARTAALTMRLGPRGRRRLRAARRGARLELVARARTSAGPFAGEAVVRLR